MGPPGSRSFSSFFPSRAVLLQHARGDSERSLVDADVLAHDEDARVAVHLFHHRVADRVAVALLAHSSVAITSSNSSSGAGTSRSSANFTASATRAAASSSNF